MPEPPLDDRGVTGQMGDAFVLFDRSDIPALFTGPDRLRQSIQQIAIKQPVFLHIYQSA